MPSPAKKKGRASRPMREDAPCSCDPLSLCGFLGFETEDRTVCAKVLLGPGLVQTFTSAGMGVFVRLCAG
jgi:hypothetical protein